MIINLSSFGCGTGGGGTIDLSKVFKTWFGTEAEYRALETTDKDTFYCIGDTNTYFGVYAVEDGTIKIEKGASAPTISLQYSKNTTNDWQTFNVNTNYNVEKGDIVYFKGVNNQMSSSNTPAKSNCFVFSNKVELVGNIQSLLFGDDYVQETDLSKKGNYTFNDLFLNQSNIVSIDLLKLGANKLKNYCYSNMFRSCTGLTHIPNNLLSASTLAIYCYNGMFNGCSGITSLDNISLNATTIPEGAFNYMFENCTSLKSVSEDLLPSTNLGDYAYIYMFNGCTSLKNVPKLPAEVISEGAYQDMFEGCTSLETIPEDLFAHVKTINIGGCTYMFLGCTSLKNSFNIPNATMSGNITKNWQSPFGQIFQGCTSLTKVSGNLNATNKYVAYAMFNGCTSLKDVSNLTITGDAVPSNACEAMFNKCTSLEKGPVIECNSLNTDSFMRMFNNCNKLNKLTFKCNNILDDMTISNYWLYGVSERGTINIPSTATWDEIVVRNENGVPENWTINKITA